MAELLKRRLPEHGRMREFTQEISWVLRCYLGRRWAQPALEATRPEILRWLPDTSLEVKEQQITVGDGETKTVEFAYES